MVRRPSGEGERSATPRSCFCAAAANLDPTIDCEAEGAQVALDALAEFSSSEAATLGASWTLGCELGLQGHPAEHIGDEARLQYCE